MTMTYSQQLLHPNWQRLRLQMLDAAGWKCQVCADADSTLHVHHKRYIRGRLAWEYPADNFSVLCDQCHGFAHETRDELLTMLASIDARRADITEQSAAAVLAGYLGAYAAIDQQLWVKQEAKPADAGYLAGVAADLLTADEIQNLAFQIIDPIGRTRILEALAAAVTAAAEANGKAATDA